MALQNSGAISLDDIHVEVGGTSGTNCSINDSDIRGLADKSDGATSSFNEFYGLSNITYGAANGGTTNKSGNFKFHIFNFPFLHLKLEIVIQFLILKRI